MNDDEHQHHINTLLNALSNGVSSRPAPPSLPLGDIMIEVLKCHRAHLLAQGDRSTAEAPTHTQCDPALCRGERIEVRRAPGPHYCSKFCLEHSGTRGELLSSLALYWCARHRRIHVCEGECERTATIDALGNKVCVLSGRVVGAALSHAFGDGTVPESEPAPRAATARAPKRGSMRELLRQTAVGTGASTSSSSSTAVAVSQEEYDPDCPRNGLFGDTFDTNSIGDGIGERLDEYYAQAWGTVHRLLFSKERNAREAERMAAAWKESDRRIDHHIKDCVRARAPVQLDRLLQLHDRAMNGALAACPGLMLPHGATRRYTANYAMAAMLRYLQLMDTAEAVVSRTKAARIRKMVARLRTYSQADVFPTVLEMLRDEAERADWFLNAVFPEPHTVEHLGIPQHTCTEVSKRFKQVLMHAATLGVPCPPHMIRPPESELLFGRRDVVEYSVVSRFIEMRLAG